MVWLDARARPGRHHQRTRREMYLPLWLRLFGAFGSPMVNIKVVSA